MAKTKLSVTVEETLIGQLQELAALQSLPVSRVVETALKQFLAARLEAEMEEGYRVMADFNLALAEADMAAGFEVLPDA
jgi:predicted transcriptional regulator